MKRKTSRRRTTPADDNGLPQSDRSLIIMVTEACRKMACFDFVDDVFSQPRSARVELARILTLLKYPGEATDYGFTPAQHHELAARLHRWCERQGLHASIADMFLLEPAQWRGLYVGGVTTSQAFEALEKRSQELVDSIAEWNTPGPRAPRAP